MTPETARAHLPSWARLITPLLAILASLLLGSLLILAAGANPLQAYAALFRAGFSCDGPGGMCAMLTSLQYATPLIFGGLSALVAFRAGLFSIGQAGQMVVGAAVASWFSALLPLSGPLLPAVAICAAFFAAALWGFIPGLLKTKLGMHEVIVTLLLNPIAVTLVAPLGWRRIPEAARLAPLVPTTKLNAGFLLALLAALLVLILLWRSAPGYGLRMSAQAPLFARFGGIKTDRAVMGAMALSSALAGVGGAVEILGVHYRFVTNFSAVDQFDGIVVALVGQLHPLGVLLSALLVGGVRLGAVNGLQLRAAVPREAGSALIAIMLLLIAAPHLIRRLLLRYGPRFSRRLS
ncbi:MAG: ABC transporter permease [Anaerolineales bacterium]|nr:ABC transporter permease [Anaerolineales bacterium]